MSNKLYYTQQLLKQLPGDDRPTEDTALKEWWQDIREDSGLRLSWEGYAIMTQLEIESWSFDTDFAIGPGQLILLNNKLTCPYFIMMGKKMLAKKQPQIIMYGSQEATMYALYGDLKRFLKYLKTT